MVTKHLLVLFKQLQMIVKPCQVAFLNYGFCQQSWSQGVPAMSGVSGKFHKKKVLEIGIIEQIVSMLPLISSCHKAMQESVF